MSGAQSESRRTPPFRGEEKFERMPFGRLGFSLAGIVAARSHVHTAPPAPTEGGGCQISFVCPKSHLSGAPRVPYPAPLLSRSRPASRLVL